MKNAIEDFGATVITEPSGIDLMSYDEKLKLLGDSLTEWDGDKFCQPRCKEDDINALLANGLVYHRDDCFVATMIGEAHQCHSNSAACWYENKESCLIVTGYALFDGSWMQHSWLMNVSQDQGECQIIETTEIAEQYFGIVLSPEQCEKFHRDNAY